MPFEWDSTTIRPIYSDRMVPLIQRDFEFVFYELHFLYLDHVTISHATFFSLKDPAFYLNAMECEKKHLQHRRHSTYVAQALGLLNCQFLRLDYGVDGTVPLVQKDPVILFNFFAGYFNSTLNPFIYVMTNQDFKRAFTAILYKYVCKVYYVRQSFKGRFKPFKLSVLRDGYFLKILT